MTVPKSVHPASISGSMTLLERLTFDVIQTNTQYVNSFLNLARNAYNILIIGAPGVGKTERGINEAARRGKGVAIAFNRSVAEENNSRGLESYTLDSLITKALGIDSLLRAYPRGSLKNLEWVETRNVEYAVERMRSFASHVFGIPYSLDPYSEAPGNLLFHYLDVSVNKAGIEGARWLVSHLVGLKLNDAALALCLYSAMLGVQPPICRYDLIYNGQSINALDFTFARAKVADGEGEGFFNGYEALFIDEFQDYSPVMLASVARLFKHVDVLIIAFDDDQCVYRRLHYAMCGEVALRLINMVKNKEIDGKVIHLKRSHRVPDNIAQVAQRALIRWSRGVRVPKAWCGTPIKGNIAVINPGEMLELVRRLADEGKRVFIIAPSNEVVVSIALSVMTHTGYRVNFLKDLPTSVRRVIEAAQALVEGTVPLGDLVNEYGDQLIKLAVDLVEALSRRVKDSLLVQTQTEVRERVKQILGEFKSKSIGIGQITIDTPYTMKGLEADAVFIINATTRRKIAFDAVHGDVRPLYVALTRTRGDLYIVRFNTGYQWFPLDEFCRVAGIRCMRHDG